MYYPYFRGKQYELITVRECAQLLSDSGFIPVIEPVKEALSGLKRSLDAVIDADGHAVVIINPGHGDHKEDSNGISDFVENEYVDSANIIAGIHLSEENDVEYAMGLFNKHRQNGKDVAFVHAGFSHAKNLSLALGDGFGDTLHIFIDNFCGKLYQKHFKGTKKILIRDGFERRTNKNHPEVEFFSDLHATYEDENMDGFGDFLMVGNEFSESGGPAYAIAIHISFIDDEKDDEMHIHHFKSIRQDSPTDPAGKFLEALDKLVSEVKSPETKIFWGEAINEFMELHERRHFPGLGYVKKLSMKHHLETLAQYLK